MVDPIPISTVIAKKVCARLDRALHILESMDESVAGPDLVEVASAIYESQQTIRRLALAGKEVWSNSPPSTFD
jgi:hypothetical protein